MGLLHVVIIFVLAWFLFKQTGQQYPRTFWLAILFKLLMGAGLGLVYQYYYSANDTWLFFHDANAAARLAKNDFTAYLKFLFSHDVSLALTDQLVNSQERSLFLIKFMSVFSWLGGNNYWISAAYFSLISFAASWYLFLSVTRSFENSEVAASLSFLFFPSTVFWSSGLVKETLALAGIYFMAGLFLKYIHQQQIKWMEWLLALYGFWIAWNLKYYWTALFAAVMLAYVIVFFLSKKYSNIQKHEAIGGLIMFILLCGGASFLHPNFHLNRFLEVLISNHDDFVKISDEHGLIHFYQLHASWSSVMLNAPWALLSGLFRPFIWEASGLTSLLAAMENGVITMLLLSALSGIRSKSPHRLLLFSALLYIALLCIFLALSTPNLGTLSRYRVGFLPFLIFIISYRNPLLTYLSNRVKFLQS